MAVAWGSMAKPVRIAFFGGLGEIGRNCAAIEIDDRLLLIDVGLLFPDTDMPGVDLVLPDFTYLRENAHRIEAAVLTHGHEDHAGALSYLLADCSFPIYSSALSLGLAKHRIEEAGLLHKTKLIPVQDNERRKIGPFDVEFIPVTHSVPHCFAIAFHTPQGVILHTGDFKLDLTPIDGRTTELSRIGALGSDGGIRLLLSDSTNAEEPGYTPSESDVGKVLAECFTAHPDKRVIVACFASHIHRIQQVADTAIASGRKVATLGLSMAKNVKLAREMGLLTIPESALLPIEDVNSAKPGSVCVISTGSQGEPMSALARMAMGQSKWLEVDEDDLVILSSHPIPGNESSVGKVIDGLYRRGVEVIHSGLKKVHSSGHARQQELKTMVSVANPEFFIPVHGEFRHLTHHSRIAMEMGVPAANVLLCEDGDVIEVNDDGCEFAGEVPAGYMYVDGNAQDAGSGVLKDRQVLSKEGVVMVVLSVDTKEGRIVSGPEIHARGWVYDAEAEELLSEARNVVRADVGNLASTALKDPEAVRKAARKSLGSFVDKKTRRRPMIVPVVMEV
jgi:ribonuclease J